ncbi:hypothetical protein ABFS83_04G052700 [Erythranthe nasuta]
MNEQPKMMNQQHQMNLNPNMMSMSQMNPQQQQPQMLPMNRSFGIWPPPPQFQNPNPNPGAMKPPSSAFKKPLGPRSNWKGKRVNKPNDKRRNEQQKPLNPGPSGGGIAGSVNVVGGLGGIGNLNFNNYQPPTLVDLQQQNRLKTRKFFSKKKFNNKNINMGMNMNMNMGANNNNNNNNNNYNNSRSAPFAPRNTTSFLIRAKKSGGIASLVSPSPMTPAVLPTPIFSPSREVLVDMAKEEWGVDGYGSMKGLIRLRSPGHDMEGHEDEDEDEGGSSESDVEEHVEVERRLDHDLSRFEMIYNPNNINVSGMEYHNVLENRVDDQDSHIAQLEDENLILKERLFLMERELGDLRRRMQILERRGNRGGEEINEEVVENDSENESGSRGDEGAHSMEDNNDGFSGDNEVRVDGQDSEDKSDVLGSEKKAQNNDDAPDESDKSVDVTDFEQENKKGEFIEESKDEETKKDREENCNRGDEDECVDMVKATDNSGIESCETVVVGRDVCMEDVGVAKDETVLQKDVANSSVTEVNES